MENELITANLILLPQSPKDLFGNPFSSFTNTRERHWKFKLLVAHNDPNFVCCLTAAISNSLLTELRFRDAFPHAKF
jgi:hypothetical protein